MDETNSSSEAGIGDISVAETRDAVERIIASGMLGLNSRLPQLLTYIVNEAVSGRKDTLKAYTIATDVLGRGANFDASTDSIVRVEMRRLRQALEQYYLTKGANDPVVIEVPSGTYQPVIRRAMASATLSEAVKTPPAIASDALPEPKRMKFGRFVAIAMTFIFVLIAGISGYAIYKARTSVVSSVYVIVPSVAHEASDAEAAGFAQLIQNLILNDLQKSRLYQVSTEIADNGSPFASTFVVDINLVDVSGQPRVFVQLHDLGGKIWWTTIKEFESGKDLPSRVVASIMTELSLQIASSARKAFAVRKDFGITESAWELYLRSTWTPGDTVARLDWEKERVALAREAIRRVPEFGQAHSVLADKLAFLATVDPSSDTPENLAEADDHGVIALTNAPDDPNVQFNLAIHHWHHGDMDQSVQAAKRAFELDPTRLLARGLKAAAQYTCEVPPRALLDEYIKNDSELSPSNPIRSHTLAWISLLAVNIGDMETALSYSSQAYRLPGGPNMFYRHAAILNKLGRTKEAVEVLNMQRRNWPTLDPMHYATVTIPRRCSSGAASEMLKKLYHDLAIAYQKAS